MRSRARLLLRERRIIGEGRFADIAIWEVPNAVGGSLHPFKYRLAFVVDEICVLRFDNEAGKGDHRHLGDEQIPYDFIDLDRLVNDFWREIERWEQQ